MAIVLGRLPEDYRSRWHSELLSPGEGWDAFVKELPLHDRTANERVYVHAGKTVPKVAKAVSMHAMNR